MSAAVALLQRLTEVATGLLDGGYLLVQDGEGFEAPPPTITLRSGAKAPVVRVDSELALRHALWQAHGALVALLPAALATDLAADLRLGAERQRVHTISGDEVLSALLWPARVAGIDDAELRSLAIEHIDLIQTRLNSRTMPTVVDRGLLERTLVEVVTELGDLRLPNVRLGVLLAR